MKNWILIVSIVLNIFFLGVVYFLYIRFYTYELKTNYHSGSDKQNDSLVMIGNSITASWINFSSGFFTHNRISNLGIGGNTSEDVLLRFRHDVVDGNYKTVILNIGINDICQSNYDPKITINNILSIVDICKTHNIRLVLSSVLPTADRLKISAITTFNIPESDIIELNRQIRQIAEDYGLMYVDYYSELNVSEFVERFTYDGVHPNYEGFMELEKILLPYIVKLSAEEKEE